MPTIVKSLDEDVREFLNGYIKSLYLDEQCYELAIALHRGLNWELVGLIQTGHRPTVRHAAVRHPDGGYFDGRGRVMTEEAFIAPFGSGEIVTFRLETELKHRTRSITERSIISAGNVAMSRWPELPWHNDTRFMKVVSFVDDLENLCRFHGFWLYNNGPSSWPMIVPGDGDEVGYALATTGNGSYTANRVLKGE